ncbi:MAG: hypothetical protein GF315_05625, partial [candidate division Zixibacteria bacterium]|nr:hypothetical protein [candidate division Zixibacteria bacterium]
MNIFVRTASVVLTILLFIPLVYADDVDSLDSDLQRKLRDQQITREMMPYLGLVIPEELKQEFEELDKLPEPALLLPDNYFDWRERGGVTPVKNQGGCGSCWAFAATGAFESSILIADEVEWDLSEQQVLVCNEEGYGCDGGQMYAAYLLFGDYGAVEETCMPYMQNDNYPCTQEECTPVAFQERHFNIPNSVVAIKNALLNGPMSTVFTVYG